VSATTAALFGSVFVASMVEFVEAFTIVLAMGVTRGWRSAISGAVAAIVLLSGFTLALGYAITEFIPESLLQLVVGVLMLIFGLQWLRKAVLRSSGVRSLHDEEAEYAEQVADAERAARTTYAGIDLYGFMISFKGVFLEGVEVTFIVVTFGANSDAITLAIWAGLSAALFVLVLGIALRAPLAKVPENTLKYGVGLMMTGFGSFWAIEGLGYFRSSGESVEWPGDRWALLVITLAWFAMTRALIVLLRRIRARELVTA
jgi:Ca2+/H+ antiporter, TMEM165/GDT1 family